MYNTLLDESPERSKRDEKVTKRNRKQERILITLNKAAFALHLISFVAALIVSIIYSGQSIKTEISVDFKRYDEMPMPSSPPQAGNFSTTLESKGFYSLIWVDLPFPLITALFHGAIVFIPWLKEYYLKQIRTNGANPLRWIEYSITATLMTWVIMQLAGITNIFILVFGAIIGNVSLQLQGYQMEQLKGKSWVPMITGWIIFMGQWSTIMAYFFTAITSERPETVASAPWFVYSIIIGLFFLFAIFGLIQLSHYAKWPRFMSSKYAQEVAFLSMSFIAKFFLTWNLLIGIASNPINNM